MLVKRLPYRTCNTHRSITRLPSPHKLLNRIAGKFTRSASFSDDEFAQNVMRGGDGREERLLAHVLANSPEGDAKAILAVADAYSWSNPNKDFYMAVGDVKAKIVQQALASMNPPAMTLLELGTYCGYGSVSIASAATAPGAKLYTVDVDAGRADVARKLIAHAGLKDRIEVLLGPLAEHIGPLRQRGVTAFDFVFIDHVKELYVSDLQVLLDAGLLRPGSVVVADNCKFPGAPEYIKYMDASPDFKTTWHDTELEYSKDYDDMVGVSVYTPASKH